MKKAKNKQTLAWMFAGAVALVTIISVLGFVACNNDGPKKKTLPGPNYQIVISEEINGGTIDVEPAKALEDGVPAGTDITLNVTPNDEWFEFEEWVITDTVEEGEEAEDAEVEPVEKKGVWTFKMPAKNITISATFTVNDDIAPKFSLTLTPPVDGSLVAVSPAPTELAEVVQGSKVILTATANVGHQYTSTAVRGASGNVAVLASKIGADTNTLTRVTTITFDMPAEDVTVSVVFSLIPGTTPPGGNTDTDGPRVLYSGVAGGQFTGWDWQLWGAENATQPQGGGLGEIGGTIEGSPPAFVGGTAHNNHPEAMFLGPNWAPYGGGLAIVMISPDNPESDAGFISLNSIDALQLWVRSSGGPLTIGYVGFGASTSLFSLEPNKYAVRYAGEDNTGIVVGNEWQKIVVPLPKRVNATMSEALSIWVGGAAADNEGKTLYVDDVELIAATVAISDVIPKARVIPFGTATPLATLLSGLHVEYTVDGGTPISLYNGRVDFNSFHTVSHAATGGTIQGINFTPDGTASTPYTFTVTVDGTAGTMNSTTSASDWVVVESMLNKGRMTYWWDEYPNSTSDGVAENYTPSYLETQLGYTHACWSASFEDYTDTTGTYDVLALMNRQWGQPAPGGNGWTQAPPNTGAITRSSGLNVNVAGCTALTTTAFATAAGTVRFTINPGTHLASVAVVAGKNDINIPVGNFSGTGTWTSVTGWVIEWTSGVAPTPATVDTTPTAFVYLTEIRLIK